MKFLQSPNLPEGKVHTVLVDGRINARAEETLKSLDMDVIKTKPHPLLYEAVCSHPDMMFHHVGDSVMVYAPDTPREVLKALHERGFTLLCGESRLSPGYPGSIAYNVLRLGNFAFHNVKYTDRVLKHALCEQGVRKAVLSQGINVLLIEQRDNILLPGLSHGFIGGATGLLSPTCLAVHGQFKNLKSGEAIRVWLKEKNMIIVELHEGEVVDIGSILPLTEI